MPNGETVEQMSCRSQGIDQTQIDTPAKDGPHRVMCLFTLSSEYMELISVGVKPTGFDWEKKCFRMTVDEVYLNGDLVANEDYDNDELPTVNEYMNSDDEDPGTWRVCRKLQT